MKARVCAECGKGKGCIPFALDPRTGELAPPESAYWHLRCYRIARLAPARTSAELALTFGGFAVVALQDRDGRRRRAAAKWARLAAKFAIMAKREGRGE